MADWRIERGGKTVVQTEQQLREALRNGALSGAEMVRPPGATGWIPLHTLGVFSEEVPVRRDSRRAVDEKTARGWVVHLAVFGTMVVYLGRGSIPTWAVFWGLGVLAHTLRGLPATLRVLGRLGTARSANTPAASSFPVAEPAPPLPHAHPAVESIVAQGLPPESDFLTQVREAVDAVQGVWTRSASALGPLPDLDGLSRAAERLEARHNSLSELHIHEDRTALEAELAHALSRQEAAPDALTAGIYGDEAAAIADRLTAVDAAVAVAEQLAARKRTLLHQLAGLRLSAGQTAATHDGPEPARVAETLLEKTHALRDALRASAEVDEALARARQAAVSRRARPL
ncbi:MAG: hypothetical protein CL927_02130 [Deltaproteobacteria bacterium]|nr:hypothetical protein [Deltaproteobacteria bacterium]HCH65341.1 hypothetical protein [Deltaproteobacteria bacterium]